jgi:undecaprenyl-diphosphatase
MTNSKFSSFAQIGREFKNFALKYLFSGFAVAVAALILFLWLAEEVFEGETKAFDENVRATIHQFAALWLTQTMIFFSFIGSVAFVIGAIIVAAIIFLRLKWRHAAIFLVLTMIGEVLLELALKLYFQRIRPEPFFNYPLPSTYSFPSGHALGSFCFYGVLAWLITRRIENRAAQILIWIVAAAIILLIGTSRIYLGVHYPSDVLAGYAAGFFWVLTVALTDSLIKKRRGEKS